VNEQLVVRGLGMRYGEHRVLADVDLAVGQGAVTAIVGPSGCGKSSFLMCCNRLHETVPGAVCTGSVLIDGQDIQQPGIDLIALRRNVAMIFQRPNPFPCSIADNLAIPLREHGCRAAAERRDRSEAALRRVGLWDEVADRLRESAARLSGGQQQRLCIARALALEPQILLLDEPCSALDPLASARIEELIAELRRDYCLVIVTHNLAQARRVADRIAVFWQRDGIGTCIEVGDTEAIHADPREAETKAYFAGRLG